MIGKVFATLVGSVFIVIGNAVMYDISFTRKLIVGACICTGSLILNSVWDEAKMEDNKKNGKGSEN